MVEADVGPVVGGVGGAGGEGTCLEDGGVMGVRVGRVGYMCLVSAGVLGAELCLGDSSVTGTMEEVFEFAPRGEGVGLSDGLIGGVLVDSPS